MIKDSANTLPVIPLADTVIFPGVNSTVVSVREISKNAIEESISKHTNMVILATQKKPDLNIISIDNLYRTGVVAEISSVVSSSDNTIHCNVLALNAVYIEEFYRKDRAFYAKYLEIKKIHKSISGSKTLQKNILEIYKEYLKETPQISEDLFKIIGELDNTEDILNFVSSNSLIPVDTKINILKVNDIEEKYTLLFESLKTEINLINLQKDINKKVKEKLEKNQKEFFLNEQLKVIRKELGKEEDEQIHKLRKLMKDKKLPERIKERAEEEIERLKKIPTISPEFGVLYNYVEWLLRLPWRESAEKEVDLKRTKEILEKNHYGLMDIKERVLEYLSVLKLKHGSSGQILCFIGPPGVGKTSLGRSISESLGRPFIRASLGGIRDEAEIRGHRKTYVGSMPGKIIQKIVKAGVKNPVFLLDEVDKIGKDFRGDPASALLEVLDTEVNYEFNDHFIEEGFDLSEVLFITTANTTHTIPHSLLDRMEIIRLPGYLEFEKVKIAENYLIPKVLKKNGLDNDNFHISGKVLHKLIKEYSREAGVRELERLITRLAQKAAKKIAFEGKDKVNITARNLKNYLGVPKYINYRENKNGNVGVANGLAVTENGGEVLKVEARIMEGSGELTLTGQLGEVMQESAKAALSLIRSNHGNYNLNKDFYKKIDLHVHVPEGAVPKDGPSAGITIFSAILSSFMSKPISSDIAMTGEITLSGDILRIGGLREKLVAAQSANITRVIVPEENRAQIKQFSKEIKKDIELLYVNDVKKAVEYLF